MASVQLDYCLFSLNPSVFEFVVGVADRQRTDASCEDIHVRSRSASCLARCQSAGNSLPLKIHCDIQTDTAVFYRFTFYPVYSAVWTFQP